MRHAPPLGLTFPLLCLFGAVAAAAEDRFADAIVTDRPDFVESSNTVGPRVFQLETSVSYAREDEGSLRAETLTTPTLLRYGFAADWEARLEAEGFVRADLEDRSTGASMSETGFSDVSLGIKWHTWDGEPRTPKPSVGWLLHADLDVGSSEFRGEGIRPSLRVSGEWELSDLLSLGVMPGFVYDTDSSGDRFIGGVFGAVLGQGWTDRWSTFVELAARQIASDSHGGDIIAIDAGTTYLLTPNWQIDGALLWGANDNTPDITVTVGISGRFGYKR